MTKKLILKHYDAIPNSVLIDRSRLCNYLGHLEGDEMNSIVAVTGCLKADDIDEKMHITILSPHSPNHKTFSVDKSGKTKHIEIKSDFLDEGFSSYENMMTTSKDFSSRFRRQAAGKKSDPNYVNENWENSARNVTVEQKRAVPNYLALNIRVGYDKSVKEYFEGKGEIVDNWLSEVLTQVQLYFLHNSLKHKIIFQVHYDYLSSKFTSVK